MHRNSAKELSALKAVKSHFFTLLSSDGCGEWFSVSTLVMHFIESEAHYVEFQLTTFYL